MTSNTVSTASDAGVVQEFTVRVPRNVKRHFSVMRFNAATGIDPSNWGGAKMERENNAREFKTEEEMPKFGAGSEFGRELREEARRKKFGIISKKYNPNDQPWILRPQLKSHKRFKGIREGGVAENASYYLFVNASDKTFEAFPIEEWYNFSPIQTYKTLNAEEAEEEFGRRDKVLNLFSIMVRKRIKNEQDGEETEVVEKKTKKKAYGKGSGELKISDMDDWVDSDDPDRSEGEDGEEGEDKKEKNKKEKGKKKNAKKPQRKKKKKGSDDDEPLEDSDDGDDEGREVDYMSDESSPSESEETAKPKKEMTGVEDEGAIRNILVSDEEDSENEEGNKKEEEETNKNPEEEEKTDANKTGGHKKDAKKEASSSDSGSDTTDSDDFDNDATFQSAMFMQKAKKKKDSSKGSSGSASASSSSKANEAKDKEDASTNEKVGPIVTKRSLVSESSGASKKPRLEIPIASGDGVTEDAVRRYLIRKPMTASELLHKFKSKKTGMKSEQMVTTIAQILKRLNPDKQQIKGKLYLSIKE